MHPLRSFVTDANFSIWRGSPSLLWLLCSVVFALLFVTSCYLLLCLYSWNALCAVCAGKSCRTGREALVCRCKQHCLGIVTYSEKCLSCTECIALIFLNGYITSVFIWELWGFLMSKHLWSHYFFPFNLFFLRNMRNLRLIIVRAWLRLIKPKRFTARHFILHSCHHSTFVLFPRSVRVKSRLSPITLNFLAFLTRVHVSFFLVYIDLMIWPMKEWLGGSRGKLSHCHDGMQQVEGAAE